MYAIRSYYAIATEEDNDDKKVVSKRAERPEKEIKEKKAAATNNIRVNLDKIVLSDKRIIYYD